MITHLATRAPQVLFGVTIKQTHARHVRSRPSSLGLKYLQWDVGSEGLRVPGEEGSGAGLG